MGVELYGEFIAVFGLITTGTVVYVRYMSDAWVTPFVLLAAIVVLAMFHNLKRIQRVGFLTKEDGVPPEEFDSLLAGSIWIGWITYGVLFSGVQPVVYGLWTYVHGAAIVGLVLYTHLYPEIRGDPIRSFAVLVAVSALLFLPHSGTISHTMSPAVLFFKIAVFYILFTLVEIEKKMRFSERGRDVTEAERISAVQVQVVQTAWVLLSVTLFVPLAGVQMYVVGRSMRDLSAVPDLPTIAPSVTPPTISSDRITVSAKMLAKVSSDLFKTHTRWPPPA